MQTAVLMITATNTQKRTLHGLKYGLHTLTSVHKLVQSFVLCYMINGLWVSNNSNYKSMVSRLESASSSYVCTQLHKHARKQRRTTRKHNSSGPMGGGKINGD